MDDYILFIDSGIGGVSSLSFAIKKLKANYIYFADNKFAPYGNKTKIFIKNRLKQIITAILMNYSIKTVVLACNTATTSAIGYLRKVFPCLNFVGTAPAIKPALAKTKKIAVIATTRTIDNLKIKYKTQKNIKLVALKSLATEIENYFSKQTYYHYYLILKTIYHIKSKTKKSSSVVLGCTHYSFCHTLISNTLKKPIFDSNNGVTKRLVSISPTKPLNKSTIKFMFSDLGAAAKEKYIKILNQILANKIKLC